MRCVLALLTLLFLAPQVWAQSADSAQFEQQIQQEFQHIRQQLDAQGVQVPDNYVPGDTNGDFTGNDWRGTLDHYHGAKQPALRNGGDTTPLTGQACINKCLSRGALPDVCDDQCGTVHDEGVFYDPGYDPGQLPPATNPDDGGGFSGVQYECFRQCRLHGDSFETCNVMCSRAR